MPLRQEAERLDFLICDLSPFLCLCYVFLLHEVTTQRHISTATCQDLAVLT